jgi:hypothetical protein
MDILSKYQNFSRLSIDEKLKIKRNGGPKPELIIECSSKSRGRTYIRKFNMNIYSKYKWICGCEIKNRVFCFTCILYGGYATGSCVSVSSYDD